MILVLEKKITRIQKDKIKNMLSDEGCIIREIVDAGRNIIGIIGNCKKSENELRQIEGVADVMPIKTSYKLVSRDFQSEDSKVKIGNVVVGGDRIVVIAGP